MEMKQLQYFVVSVDTGSISKAAEMLYTTQPHVSMTIGKMEKSLGVRLLRRSKKGVEMTVEGELVYEQARRILKDMQVIQQVQTSVKSEVFCLSSMPSNLLAGLFAEFYRREQNLQARYLEGTLEMVLHQVTHRRAELGFVFVSEFQKNAVDRMLEQRHLEFHILKETRLVLFAGPGNPYYDRKSVTKAELQKIRFVQNLEEGIPLFQHPGNLKEKLVDSQFFYRGVEVCSDHAMTQLLLKTDLGNISCLMDSRLHRDSRIHRIARLFREVAQIERHHDYRFEQLTQDILTNHVFCKDMDRVWICMNCGHLAYGDCAPIRCTVCGYPQGYFRLNCEDY